MRSYEIDRATWSRFAPGDECPCCGTVLVVAPRLHDSDPVTALCLGCAEEGLREMIEAGDET